VYQDNPDLARDLKISAWIDQRSYHIFASDADQYSTELEKSRLMV
jgi:hypothetical protein